MESGTFDSLSETWSFQPVGDHLEVDALQRVARVFRTTGNANITGRGRPQEVKIMGTDPRTSPGWPGGGGLRRPPLHGPPQRPLRGREGAIVDRKFLNEFKLKVGLAGGEREAEAGGLHHHRGGGLLAHLWPDTERFFIVNLDYLFDQIGASPYDVWADTDGVTPPAADRGAAAGAGLHRLPFRGRPETALRLRDDPGRTGIFGILTVGFIVAPCSRCWGSCSSFLSAKRRMQQLGILRAMGLSIRQLISLFLFEQGFLIFLGMLVGTLLGV